MEGGRKISNVVKNTVLIYGISTYDLDGLQINDEALQIQFFLRNEPYF